MTDGFLISAAYASEGAAHHAGPFYADPHFWAGMAFVAVVLIIAKMAGAKICSVLDDRSQAIQNRLDEARRLREEAQMLLAEYQRKQRDAAGEAQAVLDRARNEAAKLKEEAAKALEERVAAAERQAMMRISVAEEQAKREVKNLAIDIATAAAAEVLAKRLSTDAADALIEKAISDLPDKLAEAEEVGKLN